MKPFSAELKDSDTMIYPIKIKKYTLSGVKRIAGVRGKEGE